MTGEVVVLEGGDRRCIQLLLELRDVIDRSQPGTVIEVRTTDPAAPLDLPAWCHLTGHTYLGATASGYQLQVTATVRTTRTNAPWHRASAESEPA